MENAVVIEDHDSSRLKLKSDSIFRIFKFSGQNFQVGVELSNFSRSDCFHWRAVVKIEANLRNFSSEIIEWNYRRWMLVMVTVFNVLSSDHRFRQSLKHFRMTFLDLLCDLKAINEKVLATSAWMLDAVENLKACSVVEVSVVVVWAKIDCKELATEGNVEAWSQLTHCSCKRCRCDLLRRKTSTFLRTTFCELEKVRE